MGDLSPLRLIDVNEHLLIGITTCDFLDVFNDLHTESFNLVNEIFCVLVSAFAHPFAAIGNYCLLHRTHSKIRFLLIIVILLIQNLLWLDWNSSFFFVIIFKIISPKIINSCVKYTIFLLILIFICTHIVNTYCNFKSFFLIFSHLFVR